MSIQALSWVLDHSAAKGSDRLVLLSLANHANGDTWECWPGIDTVRREAGIDRKRTVTDALGRLVEAGAITRSINAAPDARIPPDRRPNLYVITRGYSQECGLERCAWCADGVSAGRTPRGVVPASNGVSSQRRTGCQETTPKPSLEPSLNQNDLVLIVADAPPAPDPFPDDPFDEFWKVYPRRTSKGTARTAFTKALRKALPEEVLDGARAFASDPNLPPEAFIPHPSTWLNGERWADGPLPKGYGQPRGGVTRQALQVDEDRTAPSGRVQM